MKKNLPITDTEYELSDSDVIISATDLKGAITSTNKTFKLISGFSDEELINKNHNVVRHPDMPPAAFNDLWNTMKSKQPWMGIVKNRCKNGDYYWVDAFVTPMIKAGQTSGYESTRVKADPEIIKRADKIYQSIWANKFKLPKFKPDYTVKLTALFSSFQFLAMAGLFLTNTISLLPAAIVLLSTSIISYFAISVFLKPFVNVTRAAKEYINNPLTQLVYTGRHDEVGQIDLSLRMLNSLNRTILKRLDQVSETLTNHASDVGDLVDDTRSSVLRQNTELEQVATAMNEMTTTVQEVARNTQGAADAADKANQQAGVGAQKVAAAVKVIQSLSTDIEDTEHSIQDLASNSLEIGAVLDVIKGVAEQTNLLALNAAIEAARAGEQGRGFAVVADEVRTLASRTQQSTAEIQSMIEKIQHGTKNAVDKMADVRQRSSEGLENVSSSSEAIQEMRQAVEIMSTLNTQIAGATEEQGVVGATIAENIENISQVSRSTETTANEMANTTRGLIEMATGIHHMISQFEEAINKK